MRRIFSAFKNARKNQKNLGDSHRFYRLCSDFARVSILGLSVKVLGTQTLKFSKINSELENENDSELSEQLEMMEITFDIPEVMIGKPNKISIDVGEIGKKISFLVHYADKPNCRITSAICTYDGKTDLSNGLLINNKLVCPEHGCEFNIETGLVEYGPAINDLPIYPFQKMTNDNRNLIKVLMPRVSPLSIIPATFGKSKNDFRKVLIVGCGGGAIGTAETLRKMTYSGDIMMFCESKSGPIQRRNLTKFTKLEGNEDMIFVRDKAAWDRFAIDMITGKKVKKAEILDDYGFVQLDDNSKYYFDALVLASGSASNEIKTEASKIRNLIVLNDIEQFSKAERLLKTSKVVAINNITFSSLELTSTILRDHPQIEVHLFDYKKQANEVFDNLGKEVYNDFLNNFRKNGVKIHVETKVNDFIVDENSSVIRKIVYGPSRQHTKSVKPDIVFDFRQSKFANNGFIDFKKYNDELTHNERGQVLVNTQQRSQIKFVFAAGASSSTTDFFTNFDFKNSSYSDSYYQGEIAAYNIMALKMPQHRTSFKYNYILGKNVQQLGSIDYFDQIYTEGSPKDLDFLSYYVLNDKIVSVIGTNKYFQEIMLLKEAFNKGKIYGINYIKEDRELFYERLKNDLASDKSIRCIRDIIYKKRMYPIEKDVFWLDEITTNDIRNENFINFKPIPKSK